MSEAQPRGKLHYLAEMPPTTADTSTEEESDEHKCSYEKKRDKRVAKMKELMLPLVQASKSM
jgi:hypothetical protein